jgi:hypothetical protein
MKIRRIRKRDGREVPFDKQKIAEAVGKAQAAVGETDALFPSEVSDVVELALRRRYQGTPDALPGIEEIQDLVEQALIELGRGGRQTPSSTDRRAPHRVSVHDDPTARAARAACAGSGARKLQGASSLR